MENAEIEKLKCDILVDVKSAKKFKKVAGKISCITHACYIVTLSSSNLFKFDKLVNIRQSMA